MSGDDLSLAVRLAQGAHALLTAPSASKFYAADTHNVAQRQTTDLNVTGGMLEWLPRETIIYDGARAEMRTSVELDNASACIGWEMICLGRPAANESFTHGSMRQSLMLTREGLPLLHEVLRFEGGDALQKCACGLGDQAVSATLFAVGRVTDDGQDLAALEACCTTLQNMLSPIRDFDDAPEGTSDDVPAEQAPAAGGTSVQARPVPLPAHMGERARSHRTRRGACGALSGAGYGRGAQPAADSLEPAAARADRLPAAYAAHLVRSFLRFFHSRTAP